MSTTHTLAYMLSSHEEADAMSRLVGRDLPLSPYSVACLIPPVAPTMALREHRARLIGVSLDGLSATFTLELLDGGPLP